MRSVFSTLRGGILFAVLLILEGSQAIAQDVVPKKIVEIPDSLFQVQDEEGFFWQLTGNGALTSGETQYLQSGMNLLVDDVIFSPGEALVRAPGSVAPGAVESKIDAVFTEKRKGLTITRDAWMDTKRSGIRVFDSITNAGDKAIDVSVSLRTTYPFGWQSLHDDEGNLLSSDPVLKLDPDDEGLTVHFSPSEGRHDTLFLTGTETEGQKPELRASTNSRELTFQYTLSLKPGETGSVFHWVIQRNLSSPENAADVLLNFSQRNQLINSGVSSLKAVSIVNFPRSAFPDEGAAPSRLRELLALNELMDKIGWHRRRGDVHWLGQTNQISGVLSRKGSLKISGNEFGERTVPLDQIAAILGSSVSGAKPIVYLRNGEVLTGALGDDELLWTVGDAESSLGIDEIQLLLLGTGASDGAPPSNASHFVKFKSGVILSIDGKNSEAVNLYTPWGIELLKLTDIVEMVYSSNPNPGFVVRTAGGSLFPAFLSRESPLFKGTDGNDVEFPVVALDAIWRTGTIALESLPQAEQWLDFSEIPAALAPSGGFLFSGNTVLVGAFREDAITFQQDGTSLSIATADIAAITRQGKDSGSGLLKFEILLKNGDRISSTPVSPILDLRYGEAEVKIPIAYLHSYRAAPIDKKEE